MIRESIKKIIQQHDGWFIFMTCSVLAFALAHHLDVFTNGFSGSDESSHFINSYFIREYLHQGLFTNPIVFAEQFYIAYPKLSLGHWPPLYYVLVGSLFLLFPATPETATWINLLMAASAGCLLATLLRPVAGFGWSLVAALMLTLLPVSLEALNFFMLDLPLTVLVLLAALAWSRFTAEPRYGLGLLYGCLAAAAILVKGNGWLLGLFPVIHILLTRRWDLLLNPRIYSGALLCLAIVLPWYLITAKIAAGGFNYKFGIDYAVEALVKNLQFLYRNIGPMGLVLVVFALARSWWRSADDNRKELSVLVYISISMITAVLLLQSIIPVDIVQRYMLPAIPFLLLLAIAGIVELRHIDFFMARPAILRGSQALSLLLLVLPSLANLYSAWPQGDLRMAQATEMILGSKQTEVVVIDGSPAGEGAFIAEALVATKGSGLYVVRSSKILSESNFMGSEYRLLAETPAEVGDILGNIGAQHIVLERQRSGNLFSHSAVLEEFLSDPDSGYRKISSLEHRWRTGITHVYAAENRVEADTDAIRQANFPKKILTP